MIFQLVPLFLITSSAISFRANCGDPMDILFLQDTTGSYDDDLPNIRRQLPRLVSAVLDEHPGSSFGVAEFRDKPYYPLGDSDSFCYKLQLKPALSASVSDLYWAYGLLEASGGGDIPEDSYQALINAALDPSVGWTASGNETSTATTRGSRLLLLITDAPPHLPGDISKYNPTLYPELPQNLPPNSGNIVSGDVTYSCLNEDYPSPQQVLAAIEEAQLNVMFLTPNFTNITGAWQWVNEDLLGQPPFFYQTSEPDSIDFLDAVLRVLAEFSQGCPTTSTSSTKATTTKATTSATSAIPGTDITGVVSNPASVSVVATDIESSPAEFTSVLTGSITAPISGDASATDAQDCYPCSPCLPPCNEDSCCNKDGLIIRVKDQPKVMILDMDFVERSEEITLSPIEDDQ